MTPCPLCNDTGTMEVPPLRGRRHGEDEDPPMVSELCICVDIRASLRGDALSGILGTPLKDAE